MSRKRRNSSSVEPDSPPSRRRSFDHDGRDRYLTGSQRPQVDAATGQAGAFPGLVEDDGLFYGPAVDGIDYLRMVRSERKGIPELLTTNKTSEHQSANEGGYYFDGAYTAQNYERTEQSPRLSKAQEYYYESLLAHHRLVRATMNCTPPLDVIGTLGASKPISFPSPSKQARQAWNSQLFDSTPHPAQIACMDPDSILQLVGLATRKMSQLFRSNQKGDIERAGAWIWAMLGKCPERGQLGSDEISALRRLARRAGEVLIWLETIEMRDAVEIEIEDEESLMSDTDFISSERLQGSNTEQSSTGSVAMKEMKDIILDAIITVVGELYGQRDLLDLRRVW